MYMRSLVVDIDVVIHVLDPFFKFNFSLILSTTCFYEYTVVEWPHTSD